MLNRNGKECVSEKLHPGIGEHIGYELGAKMVKDYHDRYGESGVQFVGRDILERILSQPGCIGLNIYKGINELGEKTYVIAGVDHDGNPILQITAVNPTGEISKTEGIIADRNKPIEGWWDFNQ